MLVLPEIHCSVLEFESKGNEVRRKFQHSECLEYHFEFKCGNGKLISNVRCQLIHGGWEASTGINLIGCGGYDSKIKAIYALGVRILDNCPSYKRAWIESIRLRNGLYKPC